MKKPLLLLTFATAWGFGTFLGSTSWVQAQPPGGGWGPPGGPPGGPGGGPGMMMMGPGGPGGPWGGRGGGGMGGGPGGGFDPTQFLSRMDTNGNGSLDPDESQGPARFMLERMARDNPRIDLTKPIPLTTLTEAFQRMRGGGPGGPGDGRGNSMDEEILEPENNSLVPGFAVKTEKIPVPGFGASGEKFSIRIEERDLKEADDRIKRYDKNNDQALDENEMKEGRWTDSPMQYDRNRDGKLSRQELATRQARRRTLKTEQEPKKKDTASIKPQGTSEEKKEAKPNPFDKISSYRVTDKDGKPLRPAGLPEWFTKYDINSDNQVSMKEYTKKWTQDAIEDFQRFDANHDGLITTKECLAAVKKGYIPGTNNSAMESPSSTDSANKSSSTAAASPTKTPAAAAGPAASGKSVDAAMRKWAESKLKRMDKDNNGFLSPEEFKEGDFAKIDTNKDGRIDVEEYAISRLNK